MFTGLVEEVGHIRSVQRHSGGLRIGVACARVLEGLKVDDSVAVNGVCQTVVECTPESFFVEAVPETLKKTTFGTLARGDAVNLERALALGDRLGGHLVQGHVDCTAQVRAVNRHGNSFLVDIGIPEHLMRYVIPVGSICIDGISLTVAELDESRVRVAIIPHTWQATVINNRKPGDTVNIEFDLIGKYVESMLQPRKHPDADGGPLSQEWLRKVGF